MAAIEKAYQGLPGNTGLTMVVDAWKCNSSFGTAWQLSIRMNRAMAANETLQCWRLTGPTTVELVPGSVKMGQPLKRPRQKLTAVLFNGFTARPGRRTWTLSLPKSQQGQLEPFYVRFSRTSPPYQGFVTPALSLARLRTVAQNAGFCDGGYPA